MPKLRLPPLSLRLTRIFELPMTWSYAGLTLGMGILVANVVFSPNSLPELAKYLIMLTTMGWLARLCDSVALRWSWLGLVGLLTLGAGLEVYACWLQ